MQGSAPPSPAPEAAVATPPVLETAGGQVAVGTPPLQATPPSNVGLKTSMAAMQLLPYQRRWIDDQSQLKIALKARQVGFSFAATLRAVLECVERKLAWIFLSKGERQSKLLMGKAQEHIQACGIVARAFESTFFEGSLIRQLEIRFPNGSVIYGLPANPDTARGYTGNVTLDEFAFHQDAAKVYSALYPTITRGFSLEVISTPNGRQGKYFELAEAAGLMESPSPRAASLVPHRSSLVWSGHKVSIYDAVAQGFNVNIAELRAGCDDEEAWLQEYCCEFLSEAANYIPLDLIIACQSEQATAAWMPEAEGLPLRAGGAASSLYLGVDIGRKRDLTVAWLFEKVGDVLWSRALLTLKGQTFEVQEKAICDLMDLEVRRCCVDQSGLGMMLAERLQQKYGERVEPVQFTAPVKERLAPLVKRHFEDRLVRIPDDREVRADLNAVKRYATGAGNVRFDAEHTDRGHADRFWALALAVNAAAKPVARLAEVAALVGQPIARGFGERPL